MEIYDAGQLVLNTALPLRSINHSKILSVIPIAVSASEKAQFLVKGFNLCDPASRYVSFSVLLNSSCHYKKDLSTFFLLCRLLCALEGKYLVQEAAQDLSDEDTELQSVKFSCSIPTVIGRGFIEVLLCSYIYALVMGIIKFFSFTIKIYLRSS